MQEVINMNVVEFASDNQYPTHINVCCGNNKIPGYWNIDAEESNDPDQIVDIRREFPFKSSSVEEIVFFHAIEHIEEKYHSAILSQFHRVLIPRGYLYISYPEFIKVATNYINNYRGMREFWKNTIYGLQRYPGDYHVSLIDSAFLADLLMSIGFEEIKYKPEEHEDYNTILQCRKGEAPISYEEIIGRDYEI